MKTITTHHVNECNRQIEVLASGEPGAGGAHYRYDVFGPRKMCGNAGLVPSFGLNMRFQNGPVDAGNPQSINGLTNEVLLAILADRLTDFQSGPFACEENARALACINDAQTYLLSRTIKRIDRGVEGTHTV